MCYQCKKKHSVSSNFLIKNTLAFNENAQDIVSKPKLFNKILSQVFYKLTIED